MRISFATSQRSTLGVEWELALIDATSLELAPRGPQLYAELTAEKQGPFREEFLQHMVELVSGVHHRVDEAVDEMSDALGQLQAAADRAGLAVLASGTHPFSRAADLPIVAKDRYHTVLERGAWWAQRLIICGTHLHVGLESAEMAPAAMRTLTAALPYLVALSAASPYWEGEDTQYASQRTMLFQQLPSAGLPPDLVDWQHWQDHIAELIALGVIADPSEIRWDVRPSPSLGTVENRAADAVPTLAELGALAALTQSLVDWSVQRTLDGDPVPGLQPWVVRENKWRAARYGVEAVIIDPFRPDRQTPLLDGLAELLERLEPVATRLSCANELRFVDELARRGPSYRRQRAAFAGGGLDAVVQALVAETRSGRPRFGSTD